MSFSVPYRYVGPEFDRERFEGFDKEAKWLFKVDNAPEETGFRSKVKNFWKRTRIASVVKKVVEGSKSLLSRLASRLTPNDTPPVSEPSREKKNDRGIEKVKFPEDETPSPIASAASNSIPSISLDDKPMHIPAPNAVPSSTSANVSPFNQESIADPVSYSERADERDVSAYRYKEQEHGKQIKFPEIEIGVVSVRARWLLPILSGKRALVQTLEIHHSGELALSKRKEEADDLPDDAESDDEFVFDDSPRLFKHRLPKDEPKPWIEPGMVAKGAMWLQPVFSGEKRRTSGDGGDGGDSGEGNLSSPTRVSHGMFR